MSVPKVTCEHLLDLHGKEEKEHVVVDVREVTEYEAGHIKGSINVPAKEIEENIQSLVPLKEKRVIVIAGESTPDHLKSIHDKLEAHGYKNVEFLSGGFDQFCEIAPLEIEPELTDLTPEEEGFVGHHESGGDDDLDPKRDENDPLY